MGVKKINSYQIFTNGAMSSTNQINSVVQNVQNFDNLGLEVVWTGTPTGTLTVNGAVNNPYPNPYSETNPIPSQNSLTFDPSLAQPSGSGGGYIVNLNQFPWPWIQVQYINSSGSGTLNVYIFEKDVN